MENNLNDEIINEILADEIDMLNDDVVNVAELIGNAPINPGAADIFNAVNAAVLMAEEEENILNIEPRGNEPARLQNYYEEIIPAMSEQQHFKNFRMYPNAFEELVSVIEPLVGNPQGEEEDEEEEEIPLRKKIYITIWILATPDSFRSVAERFGVSKISAHSVFKEIVRIMVQLIPEFIKWPNEDEQHEIEEAFHVRSRNRFPGIIGAIDGCHIHIKQPPHNSHDYYNRKGFHSIILQGTCDHTGKFIDVSIGRPGRCHDSTVFRNSSLYQRLTNPNHPLLPAEKHLLGDSGYALSLNVLTPFRDNGHLSEQRVRYNVVHASCRSIIERSFGLLKVKFRRLYCLDVQSVHMGNLIIGASCMLHNFLILHGQTNVWLNNDSNNENDDDVDNDADDDDDDDDDDNGQNNNPAVMKRRAIMRSME